ncbi:MAG: hypothetical protein V1827_01230 [Candidatus Micrarchaeota archaeon]
MKAQKISAEKHEPAKRGRFTTAMVGLVAGLALLGDQNADAGQNIMPKPLACVKKAYHSGRLTRLEGRCFAQKGTELIRMRFSDPVGYVSFNVSGIDERGVEVSLYCSFCDEKGGVLDRAGFGQSKVMARAPIGDMNETVYYPTFKITAERGILSTSTAYVDIKWMWPNDSSWKTLQLLREFNDAI